MVFKHSSADVPEAAPFPYRAAGVLDSGKELLARSDAISTNRSHDRELVDAWASAIGMTGWYRWAPFKL